MTHPYSNLKDCNFWYRAMTAPAPGHVDPVVDRKLIKPSERVSTMGSCFAQHLSKNIAKSGFNYFVAEQAPAGLGADEAMQRNFGVFSARYGNVYTARQAVQLFDRAFGLFTPDEHIWSKGDVLVDAFRPQIEPHGFATREELLADRTTHLNCVKRIFLESEWFIFTLGLTEAWRARRDGSIFPVAPGVSGGSFDADEHEFVNFTAAQVTADMSELVSKVKGVNPDVNILLTVSPVPLIATYEDRHVWVSTTASKAALRVAAEEVHKSFDKVIYFPSYEVITSPAAACRYYADDLRQVTDTGVKHVMRLFSKHFMFDESPGEAAAAASEPTRGFKEASDVVCDEEEIERAVRRAGF